MSTRTITFSEKRSIEGECCCGDACRINLYGSDLASDLSYVQEKMEAFKKRHEKCEAQKAGG